MPAIWGRRGESVVEVVAIGGRTKFGRAAELVRTAYVVSTMQKAAFRVVRKLTGFNGSVTLLQMVYAYKIGMPLSEVVPLMLISVLGTGRAACYVYTCNRHWKRKPSHASACFQPACRRSTRPRAWMCSAWTRPVR